VTSSVVGNGIVAPMGAQIVAYGSGYDLVFTPAPGYRVSDVLVDGISVGSPSAYSLTSVTSDHNVQVTFASSPFTLTYTAGANGTIVGTSPQSVGLNGSGSAVTAFPNNGFHFVNWSDAGTTNPRTDANVIASKSVTANFAPDVPASALSVSGPYNVTAGKTFAIYGTVLPVSSHIQITRYRVNSAGTWISYGRYNTTAGADGKWSITVSATRTGSWRFVVVGGSRTYTKHVLAN
jgi:hypothetical protein